MIPFELRKYHKTFQILIVHGGLICVLSACLAVFSTVFAAGENDPADKKLDNSNQSCGPICLTIVLKKLGIVISMKEAIKLTETNIDGTTMLGLKRAFEAKGLSAKGFKMSTEDLLRVEEPAIVFVNGDHFMVIDGSKGSSFIVIDYPKEPYLMPADNLERMWNGEALLISAPDSTMYLQLDSHGTAHNAKSREEGKDKED